MANTSNNKIILKNTGMLYIRMLVVMAVSFYTVRIVLEELGISDYGLYNIVGGIVVLFSFLKTTLTSASQRFFSFTIGKGNVKEMEEIFKTNIFFYLIVCAVIIILSETIGLWFLNSQLNIELDRIEAANWTYQMSIIAFILSTMTVPYESVITSHENMSFYAYVSILEAFLKLIVAYLLALFQYDKLIIYSILITFSSLVVFLVYAIYCQKKFQECSFGFSWNRKMFKEIAAYSAWNIVGTTASIVNNQGSNIVLNLYFGTVVNGAKAIASQIIGVATRFSSNFFTAVRPRLIKLYASGRLDEMYKLINQSAKVSYFLIFIIALPLILQIDYVLSLWLGHVPPYAKIFAILSIVSILIDSLSNPLVSAAQATGNIKKYQITLCIILLSGVPVSYCLLSFYKNPNLVFYITIFISLISLIARLIIVRSLIKLPVKSFLKDVVFHVCLSSTLSVIVAYIYIHYSHSSGNSFLGFVVNTLIILIVTVAAIIVFGLNKTERTQVKTILNKLINKLILR